MTQSNPTTFDTFFKHSEIRENPIRLLTMVHIAREIRRRANADLDSKDIKPLPPEDMKNLYNEILQDGLKADGRKNSNGINGRDIESCVRMLRTAQNQDFNVALSRDFVKADDVFLDPEKFFHYVFAVLNGKDPREKDRTIEEEEHRRRWSGVSAGPGRGVNQNKFTKGHDGYVARGSSPKNEGHKR